MKSKFIGIDFGSKPSTTVLHRPGTKFIYELKPGEDFRVINNKVVIIHPDHKPKIVNDDGTTTDIDICPIAYWLKKMIRFGY